MELTDAAPAVAGRLLGAPRPGAAPAPEPGSTAAFAVGDDVVHVAFGDGTSSGAEPGGIVIVRFAADGVERKLMSDYAPLRKGEARSWVRPGNLERVDAQAPPRRVGGTGAISVGLTPGLDHRGWATSPSAGRAPERVELRPGGRRARSAA